MSNVKNIFINQFSTFLLSEEKFFKNYKKIFLINFLRLLQKNYPQLNINKETKQLISEFYNFLFITPSFKNGNFTPLTKIKNFLSINKIDTEIINKIFLLMINNYIKYIFPSSNLEKLKTLTLLLDFYNKFLTIHIKEIETENLTNKIPPYIENIYKNNSKLILFGVYKGIPISNKTKILSLKKDENTIQVEANNYQLIASKFQKDIYLLDSKTNQTFKAYIKDAILHKKNLILTEIKEIKRDSLKRNYIRVQPQNTIYSTIVVNNQEYTAQIYDLSIKGISLLSQKYINLNINETALIRFKLPNDKNFVFEFTAELRSISHFNKFYRYHFYFEPTPSEEAKLEKYITKREKEIISELTKYLNEKFIDF